MAIPISYLQTLSPDDAIAFVASLQKVKEHLSQELAWMQEQVQQKTVQLQGVETLLAEAATTGLAAADVDTQPVTATVSPPSLTEPTLALDLAAAPFTASLEIPSESNGSAIPPALDEPPAAVETAPAVAKAKTRTTRKASRTSQKSNQRDRLLPQYAGMALTDVVAQVLTNAAEPLHINELLSEMYDNLSGNELKRAKISLANVLSTGKKQGKWQNVGNGLYQVKA